jgi:hypothetical protein
MVTLSNEELKVGQLVLAGRKNLTLPKKLLGNLTKLRLRHQLKLTTRSKKRRLSRKIISMNLPRKMTKNRKICKESVTMETRVI